MAYWSAKTPLWLEAMLVIFSVTLETPVMPGVVNYRALSGSEQQIISTWRTSVKISGLAG